MYTSLLEGPKALYLDSVPAKHCARADAKSTPAPSVCASSCGESSAIGFLNNSTVQRTKSTLATISNQTQASEAKHVASDIGKKKSISLLIATAQELINKLHPADNPLPAGTRCRCSVTTTSTLDKLEFALLPDKDSLEPYTKPVVLLDPGFSILATVRRYTISLPILEHILFVFGLESRDTILC